MSMRWSKSSPVASSTVSLSPEVQPCRGRRPLQPLVGEVPAPMIRSYAALCGSVSCGLMLRVERVGVAVADEDRRPVIGRSPRPAAGRPARSAMSELNASRWVLTNRNRLRAGPYVDPLVPAVEADRVAQQRDLEVDVVHRLALVERRQPVLDVHQHDVAHGQPDVAGVGAHGPVERAAGEAGRLDVRAGGDAHRHVLGAECVAARRGAAAGSRSRSPWRRRGRRRPSSSAPCRHQATSWSPIRSGSVVAISLGQQARADREVGVVDDGPRQVRRVGERDQDLRRGAPAGLRGQGGVDGAVDVRAEVQVAGHHRHRFARWVLRFPGVGRCGDDERSGDQAGGDDRGEGTTDG